MVVRTCICFLINIVLIKKRVYLVNSYKKCDNIRYKLITVKNSWHLKKPQIYNFVDISFISLATQMLFRNLLKLGNLNIFTLKEIVISHKLWLQGILQQFFVPLSHNGLGMNFYLIIIWNNIRRHWIIICMLKAPQFL